MAEEPYYDGVWIDGAPYVVCCECGAFIPSDQTDRHYFWHQTLVKKEQE